MKGALMSGFAVGDRVRWNSEAGSGKTDHVAMHKTNALTKIK